MRVEVCIDHRERDLVSLFQEQFEISYQVMNLDVGDIHLCDKESGQMIVVIERKTYSDLSSSITDGRYREQKQRLLHSIPNKVRKMYVIEGNCIDDFHLDKSVLDGFMVNTVVRDQMMIYKTEDVQDTYKLIVKMTNMVEKNYDQIVNETVLEEKEYQIFKMVKKENLNEKNIFISMISVLPQISKSIAESLYSQYQNMENMIKRVREEGENDYVKMMRILSDVKHGSNQKRIGESIAKNIMIYVMNIEEEDKKKIMEDDFGKEKKRTKKKKENEGEEVKEVKEVKEKKRVYGKKVEVKSLFSEDG